MLGELTNGQINNLLCRQSIGRLACSDGDQPYIVPVTYAFDGFHIYGQTNEGKKLEILRKNCNVCFEVDAMTDMRNWQSAIIYGTFEELEDEDSEQARRILLKHVYPLRTSSTVHTHEHEVTTEVDDSTRLKYVMYRINIKKITGRFEKQ